MKLSEELKQHPENNKWSGKKWLFDLFIPKVEELEKQQDKLIEKNNELKLALRYCLNRTDAYDTFDNIVIDVYENLIKEVEK